MSESEQVILLRLVNGDKFAFDVVFETYYRQLCIYALNYLKTPESAEDVVQDVLIKLWEKRKLINVDLPIKSYLFRAVHNKCIDFLKHLKVEVNYISSYKTTAESGYDHQEIEFAELQNQLIKAIESLPDACKKIFLMNRYDGFKYREIAIQLGISEKTVENQMGKALKQIRLVLKKNIFIQA
ncbi:MAG: RNA polymerase sigma-70 factor [Bacteroidota bacterium]